MEPGSGSLFPAFGERKALCGSRSEGLNWLSNQSFCTEDALQLHHRIVGTAADSAQGSPQASVCSKLPGGVLDHAEADVPAKRRKKKKKKHRQHKKDKTKNREDRTSSDSDPELLGDKAKDACAVRSEASSDLPQGKFMWLDDLHSQTTQTFCIDRKADPANWEYKSLYRGDLARYKRSMDACLGLNTKKQHVIWEDSSRKKKKAKKRDDRYYSTSSLQLLNTDSVPVHRGEALQEDVPVPGPGSFIRVPDWVENDGKCSGTITCFNPLGIYDASTTLWLQGKGLEEQAEQVRVPLDSSEKINSTTMARVEKFNRMLREDPGNVRTWMEFVHFQDELMKGPNPYTATAEEAEKRKRSRRVVLEKKLAILEQAIESNPNNAELKVARLELAKESWEPSTLVSEWKKVVFLHPNHTALWQRYLLFCQSQFSTFSTSKVSSIYGKCLSTLAAALDGTLLSHPALPDTEEAMLAIFLQQCHFLRQTGHSEKAIALFQALIDFTFFKPDSVAGLITKAQVEFFEPFWDSDEPRFGEEGARGWKAWMRQQEKGGWVVLNEQVDDEEEDEDGEEISDKSLPKWQLWIQVESARDSKHWLPWRADKAKRQTEEDCEDPDRQVLFDDVGSSMFKISSPHLKFQLMSSFFQFLGIPAGCSLPPSCLNVALDELSLFGGGSSDRRPLSWSDSPASGVSAVGFMAAVPNQRRTAGHCREGEDFIRTAFHQALPLFAGEERSELALSWLRYEKSKVVRSLQFRNKKQLKSQGKRSKKLAKNLLKETENRNNLALWKEYAHLEWLLGNVEDSRKVFDTAIAMAVTQGLKSSALCDLCFLYASLELELMGSIARSATCRAVYILTRFAQGDAYSPYTGEALPVNVLKARKTYEHCLQDWLTNDLTSPRLSPGQLVSLVACFALFQYLTVGIQAADALYKQASERLIGLSSSLDKMQPAKSTWGHSVISASERLTMMHVTLLKFHMRTSVYPLGPLRETLTRALRQYPGNHDLWELYLQVESKSHSASRARKFFDAITRTAKNIILPWLFAIYAEERRKERVDSVQRADVGPVYSTLPETGLSNRIKALFEHAVQSEAGVHCVLLWRMYLSFTVTQGNVERIKGLFYRALQACPWAKVLYLDAVGHLPGQLQEILDLMTEKEIRIRIPIEELEILMED
ncbi:nuclear exosome regulator NRDE2 isoform X1 [Carcharodon carcharias]|uniref:nuclear exosome regulator NRDE2 isoform X1 n=2 Tax=Carcharodon carcharias TaxID=13397 RepID=UPI001B7E8C98|nr:nuclear exosome regulator NRDE2 isoform X1 [Carcharodon carcharias]